MNVVRHHDVATDGPTVQPLAVSPYLAADGMRGRRKARTSSMPYAGVWRCNTAWQFGQTGRKSATGSTSDSPPVSDSGRRWWTWINPSATSPYAAPNEKPQMTQSAP